MNSDYIRMVIKQYFVEYWINHRFDFFVQFLVPIYWYLYNYPIGDIIKILNIASAHNPDL